MRADSREREALRALVCRARGYTFAIPLTHVGETMRARAPSPLAGAPSGVSGVVVIRGMPTPVVEVASLLDRGRAAGAAGRFVTVKVGDRMVALAVEEVLGVRAIPAAHLHQLPPLLREATGGLVDAIGRLDEDLLVVLRSMTVVPEAIWQRLSPAGGAR